MTEIQYLNKLKKDLIELDLSQDKDLYCMAIDVAKAKILEAGELLEDPEDLI